MGTFKSILMVGGSALDGAVARGGVLVLALDGRVRGSNGEVLELAGFRLEVRETPGHSSGHVVFLASGLSPLQVFGGDVLFAGSVGRTDFPDCSFEVLKRSIHEKLFPLPDDSIVLPGHGPATTIGAEKQANPFVGLA